MFSKHFQHAITLEVFKDSNYGHLHDVVLEVTGKTHTNVRLRELFENLPEDIQCDALKWGLSDTDVRGNIYEYLLKKVKNNE